MQHDDEFYKSLQLQYRNPKSLDYKKLRFVDSYINGGEFFLDIGVGVGELIELQKQKFDKIYGIDIDKNSVNICCERFKNDENIYIMQDSIDNLENIVNEKFDYVTCLDVLEHIDIKGCNNALNTIYNIVKDGGKFIFSGPGIFEKVRIFLGKSPTHLHSHSSYGWRKMIEEAGFNVISIETVEFPIIHMDVLRKKIHLFGKCCLIVSEKVPSSERI